MKAFLAYLLLSVALLIGVAKVIATEDQNQVECYMFEHDDVEIMLENTDSGRVALNIKALFAFQNEIRLDSGKHDVPTFDDPLLKDAPIANSLADLSTKECKARFLN